MHFGYNDQGVNLNNAGRTWVRPYGDDRLLIVGADSCVCPKDK